MKKLTLWVLLICCFSFLPACNTNNNLQITPQNVNTNIANCYFLLSGDYGERNTDRNAVLTNTLYHITEANIDTLNALLPLVASKFKNATTTTTPNTNSNYLGFNLNTLVTYPNLNGNNQVNIYYNKTSLQNNAEMFEINGVMFKPEQNNQIAIPQTPQQEQVVNAINNTDVTISFEHTLDTEHTNTSTVLPESLYTINAITGNNGQQMSVFETNNPTNVVRLNYDLQTNTATYVVNKNELTNTIKITQNNKQIFVSVTDYNSVIDYTIEQGVNMLNFSFIKTNTNVDSTKTGGGTITLNENQVSYVLDSDIKFVKALNTIKNYE